MQERRIVTGILYLLVCTAPGLAVEVNLDRYDQACGVKIVNFGDDRLGVSWPASARDFGFATLDFKAGEPLLSGAGLVKDATSEPALLAWKGEPLTFLTVGTRRNPPGRPP